MKALTKVILLTATTMLASCSLYQKYEATFEAPANLMGDAATPQDTVSMGAVGWRQMFTDSLLQQLIQRAMDNNTDVQRAQLTIEQAQNELTAAKQGYAPTLTFEPTGALKHFNHAATRAFATPLVASWQLSIFGQVATKKRRAKALRQSYDEYRQAVQANLAANVASAYYSLVMLDRKLQILQETRLVWEKSLESMQILYEAGLYQSPAVHQMEASLASVQAAIIETQEDILTQESALCLLLSETPHHIRRAPFGSFQLPRQLHVGIPLQLLALRADVRQAQRDMEVAFYDTQQARQAFYPAITISGNLGWSNGEGIVNPANFLAEAVASLVQPLFAQGKLRARYKNAKIEQEKALLLFTQTLLTAGNEVYTHLHTCLKAQQKEQHIATMVSALREAYVGTLALMDNGTNTYLEVLKAQEDLLTAQLSEVENRFNGVQAFINLYNALGGF